MKKQKKNTAALVYDLAKPIADDLGLYLWDVRFEKEGADWVVLVIIDADDGITFDDCEALSRPLSSKLDEHDFIEQSYSLEVASPGLRRELKKPNHFEVCIGDDIAIKLIRPVDGEREFFGVLVSFIDNVITIESESGEQSFNFTDCSNVRLNDDVDTM